MAGEELSQEAKLEPVNLNNEIKVENENLASNLSEIVEVSTKEDLPIVQPNAEEIVPTSGENTKGKPIFLEVVCLLRGLLLLLFVMPEASFDIQLNIKVLYVN